MAEKTFKKIGQMKEGSYVLIDDEACRIKSAEKSKPGKHGTAKSRITAIGLFDDQKRSLLKSTGDDGEVPIIEKGTAQVVAKIGDSLNIMDTSTYQTYDVKAPADIPNIAQGMEAEFIKYGDKIRVVRAKKVES